MTGQLAKSNMAGSDWYVDGGRQLFLEDLPGPLFVRPLVAGREIRQNPGTHGNTECDRPLCGYLLYSICCATQRGAHVLLLQVQHLLQGYSVLVEFDPNGGIYCIGTIIQPFGLVSVWVADGLSYTS